MGDYTFTLPSGHRAVVDDADAPLIERHSWFVLKLPTETYVQGRVGSRDIVLLHRVLAGAGLGDYVDHRDGDGLNDRRSNLRRCTPGQNLANVPDGWSHNRSGYRGVSWCAQTHKWRAVIVIDGRQRSLGRHPDPVAAAQAYDVAALEAWGEFAVLNLYAAVRDAGFPDPLSRRARAPR